MRFEGILLTWNDERGFGFIEPALGGQQVFVHAKAFPRGAPRPVVGQRLSFEVELGPQGRKRARNVQAIRPARSKVPNARRADFGTASLFAIPAFLVVILVVGLLWRPPTWFVGVYLGLSVLTFLAYVADKRAARSGGRRTPENTLHLLSLAGGWPGALVAQQLVRHKSSKASFRAVFRGTVIANVAGYVLLCSPAGRVLWAGG